MTDLTLKKLKTLHDKGYQANQVTREEAANDLVFYWITQWDDQLLNDSQLSYRGEFNIIRKAGRQILTDLKLNPVQPDFKPKDEARNDDAELMDGLYRADDRKLTSQEAYDYASQEAVVCGNGSWELYTEYKTNFTSDDTQEIHRRYIPEANNNCFWDPNSRRLDRSDANYCSILYAYSEDGYKELVHELTGEEVDEITLSNFASPEQTYVFPWVVSSNKYHVVTFYKRSKVKDKVVTFTDPLGQSLSVLESTIEDIFDELLDGGYEIVSSKEIERFQIKRYVASGERILSVEVVAGQNIPVVPMYGERQIVEGEEMWQGVTRLAKDPQRLRNFQMSYMADIVSRSPRPKPIFYPEQIAGFENMYSDSGADSNFPYNMQNRLTPDGELLPAGPVGMMPEQQAPTALLQSMEMARQAVDDVANAGMVEDISDPSISGKAVAMLQNRLDSQSYIYQHNFKFAKRRDAEIYASMASDIIDTPRTLTIETADGNTKQVSIMDVVIDSETGEPVVINDITNMEMDVYAEVGKTYQSQKEQTLETMSNMMASMDVNDPMRDILMLSSVQLMDGVGLDAVRKYARNKSILQGYEEPETEEEMLMLQQAQGEQQPDANTLLAQAENRKADAMMMREQREASKDAANAQNNAVKNEISAFEAETDRLDLQVRAEKAGADIQNTNSKTQGQMLDNANKVSSSLRASIRAPLTERPSF